MVAPKSRFNRREEMCMNHHQLKCFLLLAENLNFTRVAEKMFMTQSAVSQQIKTLEDELGARLFIRSPQKVTLTATGSAFYQEICAPVLCIEAAANNVRFHTPQDELTVGYFSSGDRYVPKFLKCFLSSYPKVHLKLVKLWPNDLITALHNQEIDCAFLVPYDLNSGCFAADFFLLGKVRLYAIMDAGHPLAHRTSLDLADLSGYVPRIGPPQVASRTVEYIRKISAAMGEGALSIEWNDSAAGLAMVAATQMIILRAGYAIPENKDFAAIPLNIDFQETYGIVAASDRKSIVSKFICACQKAHVCRLIV